MDIAGLGSASNLSAGAIAEKTLGKEDFLNLLLKQLSYQDPLNPMDSTEFTSQLSQFSSLEQLNNINSTLNDVLSFQHSMQNASVTNFIGKTVRTDGNTIYLKSSADLNYELAGDASSVKISVTDGKGNLVWSGQAGAQAAGPQTFAWDGKDASGNQLQDGTYTFSVEALNGSGNPVTATTSASGVVTSVVFGDDVTYLVLEGGRNVYLGDIKSIG